MEPLAELRRTLLEYGTGPLLSEMPRRTLADKGIAGPTAAHYIEELHTPLNLAYVTFTTGTSAFQTPVGVTWQELPARSAAGIRALEWCGVPRGETLLVTYPPLVNVFSRNALEQAGVRLVESSANRADFPGMPLKGLILFAFFHWLTRKRVNVFFDTHLVVRIILL